MAIVQNTPRRSSSRKPYGLVTFVGDPSGALAYPLTSYLSEQELRFEMVVGYENVSGSRGPRNSIVVCLMNRSDVDKNLVLNLRSRFKSKPILVVDFHPTKYNETTFKDKDISYMPWREDMSSLFEHLRITLSSVVSENNTARKITKPESNKPTSLSELADRIDTVAGAISDLRLNSTSHSVEQLNLISKSIRDFVLKTNTNPNGSTGKSVVKDALLAISTIYDAVENSRLAAIIVSGAVASIISGGGWSATMCFTVGLASWNGKEAFLAALNKLPVAKGQKSLPSG